MISSIIKINQIYFLFVAIGIICIHNITLAVGGSIPSDASAKIWNFTYSFIVASWSYQKIKKNNISTPYEMPAFLFFLWTILLPYYLYKSEKMTGIAKYLGILIASFSPVFIYLLVDLRYIQ